VIFEETIAWHSVAEQLPDADITVLVRSKNKADAEPVWLGCYEDGCWFSVDACQYSRGAITHWAHRPRGPA
jgi:hypothetical protein